MDFNQIRYFLAVADTLNFTRAAERCYVSQPALSQAIKRLETELGGELFHRDGRHTELTELGKTLRGQFEQIDRAQHLVRTTAKAVTSGELGELNLGVMCTIGPRLLTTLLDDFQMQYPMVSLVLHDVTPDAVPHLLLSGALDGAFCTPQANADPRLRFERLFEEPMVVGFPPGHTLEDLDEVPLRELAHHRYVDRLHCEFRSELFRLSGEAEVDIQVVFRSQREDWIQSLVRSGAGVTVLPRFSLLLPELEHRLVVDPSITRQIAFAVVEQAPMPRALGRLLRQVRRYDWTVPGARPAAAE